MLNLIIVNKGGRTDGVIPVKDQDFVAAVITKGHGGKRAELKLDKCCVVKEPELLLIGCGGNGKKKWFLDVVGRTGESAPSMGGKSESRHCRKLLSMMPILV